MSMHPALYALFQFAFFYPIVMSFFWNVLIACFLVFLGVQLGVGGAMTTAVIVVLGIRIFSNSASIRRLIFKA